MIPYLIRLDRFAILDLTNGICYRMSSGAVYMNKGEKDVRLSSQGEGYMPVAAWNHLIGLCSYDATNWQAEKEEGE